MFWGKKKPETETPTEPARTPIVRPPARSVTDANASRRPRPEPQKTVTVQDLPEMLLASGNVTMEQLQSALEIQRKSGEFIGEILVNEGALDENSLVAFLAKNCKIPHLSLLDYLIDETLLSIIPPDFCLRYRLVPIDKMGRNLTVAMVNPLDAVAMASLTERCQDLRIKPILCTSKHFEAVTSRLFDRKSIQRDYPPQAEMPADERALREALAVPTERIPSVDLDLGADDLTLQAVEPPPSETAMTDEAELPPAGGFDDSVDVFDPPPVEEDPQNVLLDNVFGVNSDGFIEESGDGIAPDGTVIFGKMTRKMTTVMMQSMRNTYGVLARRVTLFRGLDPEAVAKLFARGKTVEYDAGQVIFNKGELGRCMYVILSGSVDILDDGRLLAQLEQGENFGEMALLSNAARSASAQTATRTSLFVLSFADITHDLDKRTSVQLLVNITVTLSARLRRAQSL